MSLSKFLRSETAKNFFFIFFSDIAGKALVFLVTLYIANEFGRDKFGVVSFAQALSSYLFLLSTFGLGQIMLREIIKDKDNTGKYIFNITLLRTSMAFLLLCGGFIFLYFSDRSLTDKTIISLYLLSAVFMNWDIPEAYDAFQKSRFHSVIKILFQNSLYFLLTLLIIYVLRSGNIVHIVVGYAVSVFAFSLTSWLFFKRAFGHYKYSFEPRLLKYFFVMAIPIAFTRIMAQLYNNMDIVMLGFMGTNAEVGIYSAAYKVIYMVMVLEIAVGRIITPKINYAVNKGHDEVIKILRYTLKIKAFYALPITFGGILLADKIIPFMFKRGFGDSILVLKILLIWIGLQVFNPVGIYLFASHQNTKYVAHIAIGGVSNILLNILLIPKFSYYGAAVSTIISGLLVEGSKVIMCTELIKELKIFRTLRLYLLNSLLMAAGIFLLRLKTDNLFVLLFSGIAIYGVLSLLNMKKILRQD